jgi:hypothetical protein
VHVWVGFVPTHSTAQDWGLSSTVNMMAVAGVDDQAMNPPDGHRVTVAGPFAVDTWRSSISGAEKPETNMGPSASDPLASSTGSEPCESFDGTGTQDLVPLPGQSVARPLSSTVWHVPVASGCSSTFQLTPS